MLGVMVRISLNEVLEVGGAVRQCDLSFDSKDLGSWSRLGLELRLEFWLGNATVH